MNIIVVSYYNVDEITPRAFRTKSLVAGLANLGHQVELITPLKGSKSSGVANSGGGYFLFKSLLRKVVITFLPGYRDLKHVPFYLKKMRNRDVDLVVSVGLPFSVHLSVAIAKSFFNLRSKSILFDYGDPYSLNPDGQQCFYAKNIEAWCLKKCDYVLTPVQKAVPLFKKLVPDEHMIKVIPQGYDIKDVQVAEYKPNRIPVFCYAGVLIKGIREPLSFLNYLSSVESDFLFVVYTNLNNYESMRLLLKYKEAFGDRLQVNSLIPRQQCIKRLSQMDFLVNFSNEGGVQQPSKLVDYVLSGRPYISIGSSQTDFSSFERFLDRDYSGFVADDISCFDQDLVAKKILDLAC